MAKEELEIEIGPDGKVSIRTVGIKGPRCLEVAEAIARIIGEEQSRRLTSEYYESQIDVKQHVDIRHRT